MGAGSGAAAAQFTTFYDASFRRTAACVYALCGDIGEAEEVAQEAYARAWSRWRTLQSYDDPGAWVRQVASRLAVSRWRRTRTVLAHAARLRGREQHADPPSDDVLALTRALSQLPEAQRRAIVLHYVGDLPVAEVARVEGVPDGTVKARLSRGRTALAQLLDTSDNDRNGEPSHA